jgi:hypothetical protein
MVYIDRVVQVVLGPIDADAAMQAAGLAQATKPSACEAETCADAFREWFLDIAPHLRDYLGRQQIWTAAWKAATERAAGIAESHIALCCDGYEIIAARIREGT